MIKIKCYNSMSLVKFDAWINSEVILYITREDTFSKQNKEVLKGKMLYSLVLRQGASLLVEKKEINKLGLELE